MVRGKWTQLRPGEHWHYQTKNTPKFSGQEERQVFMCFTVYPTCPPFSAHLSGSWLLFMLLVPHAVPSNMEMGFLWEQKGVVFGLIRRGWREETPKAQASFSNWECGSSSSLPLATFSWAGLKPWVGIPPLGCKSDTPGFDFCFPGLLFLTQQLGQKKLAFLRRPYLILSWSTATSYNNLWGL